MKAAEAALDQAFALTEEARRELDALLSRLEVDAALLERKEERLFALRAAARKYAVKPDDLPRILAEYQTKLESISGGDAKLKELGAAVVEAHDDYVKAAQLLSAARRAAAVKLGKAVARELGPLSWGMRDSAWRWSLLGEQGNAQRTRAGQLRSRHGGRRGVRAARENCFRRRARALFARPESGAWRSKPACGARVRRSGSWRGRGRGRCRRRKAPAPRERHAGSARHAFAAGRGAGRAAFPYLARARPHEGRTAVR